MAQIIFIILGFVLVYDCWRMFDYKKCNKSRWDCNCKNWLCLKYEKCGMQDDTEENEE